MLANLPRRTPPVLSSSPCTVMETSYKFPDLRFCFVRAAAVADITNSDVERIRLRILPRLFVGWIKGDVCKYVLIVQRLKNIISALFQMAIFSTNAPLFQTFSHILSKFAEERRLSIVFFKYSHQCFSNFEKSGMF